MENNYKKSQQVRRTRERRLRDTVQDLLNQSTRVGTQKALDKVRLELENLVSKPVKQTFPKEYWEYEAKVREQFGLKPRNIEGIRNAQKKRWAKIRETAPFQGPRKLRKNGHVHMTSKGPVMCNANCPNKRK